MDTETEDCWATSTPSGWLAGSTVFPRIAVFGDSEQDARERLQERRDWWRSLPGEDDGDHA